MLDERVPFLRRHTCSLCNGKELAQALELSPIPIVTTNVDPLSLAPEDQNAAETFAPLELNLCKDCGHLQLSHVVRPDIQYKGFRYVTSISVGLPEHFRQMVRDIVTNISMPDNGFVVEIGSNDGTLLKCFKEDDYRVLGIDPAQEIAREASLAGVNTLPEFFNAEIAQRIVDEYGRADLVIANNTFANLDNLDDIMHGLNILMDDDGAFVFETQYGRDVVENLLIDTIYHEHLSYFMVGSMVKFFHRHGFVLSNVEKVWTKGGSIRCLVRRKHHAVSKAVASFADAEVNDGFLLPEKYAPFRDAVDEIRKITKKHITNVLEKGGKVAGYGASVGSMTLIAMLDLADKLDCIFDDNPMANSVRIGQRDVPILESNGLYEIKPDLVVLFAWRYADLILERHQPYLDGMGQFLIPLSSPRIEGASLKGEGG